MHTVKVTGWKPGLRKVALTKIIRKYTGMSLAEGKRCTDQILAHTLVEFERLDIGTAHTFLRDLQSIGAEGEILGEITSDR